MFVLTITIFLPSLISRLGRNGSDELKAHRWFAGVDWSALRAVKAPHLPPGNTYHTVTILILFCTVTCLLILPYCTLLCATQSCPTPFYPRMINLTQS